MGLAHLWDLSWSVISQVFHVSDLRGLWDQDLLLES